MIQLPKKLEPTTPLNKATKHTIITQATRSILHQQWPVWDSNEKQSHSLQMIP